MATLGTPADTYNSLFNQAQSSYQNILAGYGTVAGGLGAAQGAVRGGYGALGPAVQGQLDPMQAALTRQNQRAGEIQTGYGDLASNVQRTIKGVDASQRQAIQDQYANSTGAAEQNLISRGLGNSTVRSSVERGLQLDRTKADIALSNQTAQLQAGYQSQLGLAGLNYANQSNLANTAQTNLLAGQRAGYTSSLGQAALGYGNQANLQQLGLAENSLGFQQQAYGQAYPNAAQFLGLNAQQQALLRGGNGPVIDNRGGSSDPFGFGRTGGGGSGGGGGYPMSQDQIDAERDFQLQLAQANHPVQPGRGGSAGGGGSGGGGGYFYPGSQSGQTGYGSYGSSDPYSQAGAYGNSALGGVGGFIGAATQPPPANPYDIPGENLPYGGMVDPNGNPISPSSYPVGGPQNLSGNGWDYSYSTGY